MTNPKLETIREAHRANALRSALRLSAASPLYIAAQRMVKDALHVQAYAPGAIAQQLMISRRSWERMRETVPWIKADPRAWSADERRHNEGTAT